jgi:hypothetical protein
VLWWRYGEISFHAKFPVFKTPFTSQPPGASPAAD